MRLGAHDPFGNMATWSAEEATLWVAALRLRTSGSDQLRLRARIIELAGVRTGDQVAELGCGTGSLLVDLARAVGPSGHATGYEPQPDLAAAARETLAGAGLAANAEVVASGDFDHRGATLAAIVEQSVFIHLPEELIASTLEKGVTLLRPGGRWVSADQDGDTWTIDHPNRELTRKVVAFNSDYRYADGWTGRRLHRLLDEAGFSEIHVSALAHVDTEPGSYLYEMALRVAASARDEGVLSHDEHDSWTAPFSQPDYHFFSSINYYVAAGVSSGF